MTVAGAPGHLGIVELAARCASMAELHLEWFRRLGGWVVDTADGRRQRLFAEACHRHAWHAELWAARAPALDGVVAAPDRPPAPSPPSDQRDHQRDDRGTAEGRAAAYAAALERMLAELGQLTDRVDPRLDPATVRTAALVRTDLVDLHRRITADG